MAVVFETSCDYPSARLVSPARLVKVTSMEVSVMDRNTLIAWLNNAHAMERELLPVIRAHAEAFKDTPGARQRLEQHANETEQHAERVRKAVHLLGSEISTIKSGLASIAGNLMSFSTVVFSDELVKNALLDYGAEQFEVGAYTALVAAAEELNETEVANLCRQNLQEDEAMATWLKQRLPKIVRRTLREEESVTREGQTSR
jgi:ferritin-like metal-binding protein YciE